MKTHSLQVRTELSEVMPEIPKAMLGQYFCTECGKHFTAKKDRAEEGGYSISFPLEVCPGSMAQYSRSGMMERRTRNDLLDVLARVLHYQDKGDEPPPDSDYATLAKEMEALPQRIVERYQNDAKFHAQVNRALAMVIDVIEKRS